MLAYLHIHCEQQLLFATAYKTSFNQTDLPHGLPLVDSMEKQGTGPSDEICIVSESTLRGHSSPLGKCNGWIVFEYAASCRPRSSPFQRGSFSSHRILACQPLPATKSGIGFDLNDAAPTGQPPTYSYISGCSQGGCQDFILAKQYLDVYDAIAASVPAINWNEFFVGDYYATMLMNVIGEHSAPCEFTAITDALLAASETVLPCQQHSERHAERRV
ncbi:hypothetical protein BP6252_00498 [Coleophoma cylindrospora]|uniref:Carboxylic ester hydrolase n=1 Tax=Coleophoma cylindrospora TaxID=1849047 RepID=A0A3D8SQ72_9HELO|nr:hypothetical protein BP6252_00498 [Coleophoma cylindrospora]